MNRIISKVGVGDMALSPIYDEPRIERAPATVFDEVAQIVVLEGSPTTHQSICSPRELSDSITFTVPFLAGPSSSEVMRKPIRPA